jgi:hypothetical protein
MPRKAVVFLACGLPCAFAEDAVLKVFTDNGCKGALDTDPSHWYGDPPVNPFILVEGVCTKFMQDNTYVMGHCHSDFSTMLYKQYSDPGCSGTYEEFEYAAGSCMSRSTRVLCPDPEAGSGLPPEPPAPPPPVFIDDGDPCKLQSPSAVSPVEAYRMCYSGANGGDAAILVLMKTLAAGDIVLAANADTGALSIERVIVNQHRAHTRMSSFVELHHSAGTLTLTPDHVLLVNGAFAAARDAKPGSTLTLAGNKGAVVQRVTLTHGAVINPVTASGTVMAADGAGEPVIAATHPEWSAPFMMSSKARYSLFYCLATAFPTIVQAYYDAVVEPAFETFGPYLKPATLTSSAFVVPLAADSLAVTGFVLFTTPTLAALAALAVLGARVARK